MLAFAVLVSCHAGLAAAQSVPSSFNDLQFLVKPGDRVTVVDAAGVETTGRIAELGASVISVESQSGERRFKQDDVIVIRQRRADSLKNGMLIGAAIGGGLGFIAEASCGWNDDACGRPGVVTFSLAVWGVGIGALADGLLKTQRDIFRHGPGTIGSLNIAPIVGLRTAGAQVALRW
jgi:hypothetical protein